MVERGLEILVLLHRTHVWWCWAQSTVAYNVFAVTTSQEKPDIDLDVSFLVVRIVSQSDFAVSRLHLSVAPVDRT